MFTKKLLSAAIATSSLLAGVASAAIVTLSPTATNGGAGQLSATAANFQTTGGTLILGNNTNPAVLTISGTSGVQGFAENGLIQLTSFVNPAATNPGNPTGTLFTTGLNTPNGYTIFANFALNGTGAWIAPNQYQAFQAGLTFNGSLFARRLDGAGNFTGANINLGSLSLLNSATSFAVATTQNTPVNNGTGTANTTFSAVLDFQPAAGTTGANGFFFAPTPFQIDIALGSVGGNDGNTNYSVSNTGVVTITTPSNQQSPSTGNFTFVSNVVPEPGMLSLAGLALVGAAVASRRKKVVAA